MMPPPAPPDRANAAAFHFHSYDYQGDTARGPFQLSNGLFTTSGTEVYSLVQDLQGLVAWGNAVNHVPNLTLTAMSAVPGGTLTLDGRETLVLSFGGPLPGSNLPDVPAVVFTGGIHAREWIAVEIVYLLAEYLIKHYNANPQGNYQPTIRQLVDSRRIYCIPMLNPDGNHETVFANRLWRKNTRVLPTRAADWVPLLTDNGNLGTNPPPFRNVRGPAGPPDSPAQYDVPVYDPVRHIPPAVINNRVTRPLPIDALGVDLNRNLNTLGWGYDGQHYADDGTPSAGGSYNPLEETYFGPGPASERETANLQIALRNAAQAGPGISASIDYHSRGQFVLYPTEAYDYGDVGPHYRRLGQTVWNLVKTGLYPDYRLGIPRDLLQGDATGTVMDRAAQLHNSQALTIELDPDLTVANGWLLPEDQICDVFERNIRGALAVLSAPQQPPPNNQVYAQIVNRFDAWNVVGRGNRLPA